MLVGEVGVCVIDFDDAAVRSGVSAAMLGPPQGAHADPDAWRALEDRLGLRLPDSFKALTDMYAPVLLNEHLFLKHPATARRNLGASIDSTIAAFRRSRSAEREGHLFGGPDGLVPLLGTDRGEYLFFASGATSGGERLVASNGDEPVLYDYRVDFAEWFHRYLIGEPMFGPDSEAFYEGPVVLESMPLKEGDEVRVWYGPDRGM
ncbi:SMI1/KNR4 family protein [Streptomyces sp. NPDC090026]|uniref:SMI1/KNR4 family protein n=1 Tax=Streptomyces sp. NPDC090026 TaxID=3365923 RepID=UPI0038062A33